MIRLCRTFTPVTLRTGAGASILMTLSVVDVAEDSISVGGTDNRADEGAFSPNSGDKVDILVDRDVDVLWN